GTIGAPLQQTDPDRQGKGHQDGQYEQPLDDQKRYEAEHALRGEPPRQSAGSPAVGLGPGYWQARTRLVQRLGSGRARTFVTGRSRSALSTRSELIEIDAALVSLTPGLNLMVPANLVCDFVPAGLDALGRFLRRDVLVHHVGEVVVEHLEVLVVALDEQQ